jgi:hypothetical protein
VIDFHRSYPHFKGQVELLKSPVMMADLPLDSSMNELLSNMAPTESMIEELVAWASQHGTKLDPRVEIYHDDITGLSFRAVDNIPRGTSIAFSSPATSLSYLNVTESSVYSRHSAAFPPRFIAGFEGPNCYVIGLFFLVQQYLMGRDSFWYPYIRTLPQPHSPGNIPTPVGWSTKDLCFLKDTVTALFLLLRLGPLDIHGARTEDKMLI